MYQDYDEVPPNHAPSYYDVPIHPLLAAISGNMDKYANAQDRLTYQNHFSYPIPPMADGTHVHDSYPSGAAAGWGGGQTGTSGTGHSGHGYESPSGVGGGAYEYPPPAPVHAPTGGSYSPHTTGGTSYGGYAPTPSKYFARPHPTLPSKGSSKKKKKKNNSNANTMNALTLLAFFFFINLLQNCLKDNMEAMNPTVMVMTAKTARDRNNKLAEINSREQSTSSASAFTSGANIVVQPEDVVSAAAASAGVTSVNSISAIVSPPAAVTLQTSPYSDGGSSGGGVASKPDPMNVGNHFAGSASNTNGNSNNNNYNNNQQSHNGQNNVLHQPSEPQISYGINSGNTVQQHNGGLTTNHNQQNNNKHNYNHGNDENPNSGHFQFSPTQSVRPGIVTVIRDSRPEFYDSEHLYPNQTINSATSLNKPYHLNQHIQQQQHNTGYPHEHFEQEEYEPQLPQQHTQPQTEHYQHQFEQNPFQQQQHQQQQHYHDLSQQRPSHQDQYEEAYNHFQHHYQHAQHQSPYHSHRNQQQHYTLNRLPLRPHRDQSESSHPWSYGSSSLNAYKRGSYTWSSDSMPSHVSGHNNFGDSEDGDDGPYADAFYTRE